MRAYFLVVAPLLASCATQSQTVGSVDPAEAYAPFIGKMGPCPTVNSVKQPLPKKGVARIVLPDGLKFENIPRKARVEQNSTEDPEIDDERNDPDQNENLGIARGKPFDIHLMDSLSENLVAIKIIKKKGKPYLFYDDGAFLGSTEAGAGLCGAHFITGQTGAAKRRQVVVFFVNTAVFKNMTAVPFMIGVVPDDYQDMKIFIDPKVRNDG